VSNWIWETPEELYYAAKYGGSMTTDSDLKRPLKWHSTREPVAPSFVSVYLHRHKYNIEITAEAMLDYLMQTWELNMETQLQIVEQIREQYSVWRIGKDNVITGRYAANGYAADGVNSGTLIGVRDGSVPSEED